MDNFADGIATISNMDFNGDVQAGSNLELGWQVQYNEAGTKPAVIYIEFEGEVCFSDGYTTRGTTTRGTTPTPGTTQTPEPDMPCDGCKYDYNELIRMSNLFYQAQRSGYLDIYGDFNHQEVPYRGDSSLNDGSDQGVDLTGGYHDGE